MTRITTTQVMARVTTRKTTHSMTAPNSGEDLRSALCRASPALMSYFSDWIQTSVRRMSVDFPVIFHENTSLNVCRVQLQAFLSTSGCSIETVTIIREKSSGTSPFVFASAHTLTYPLSLYFIRCFQRLWICAVCKLGTCPRFCRPALPVHSSTSASVTWRICYGDL